MLEDLAPSIFTHGGTRCPCLAGVTTLAELRAPGVPAIDGLAEILFPTGLPSHCPRGFSTVMTDSFTHRTYVGGLVMWCEVGFFSLACCFVVWMIFKCFDDV